jgi:hypothetical protein
MDETSIKAMKGSTEEIQFTPPDYDEDIVPL